MNNIPYEQINPNVDEGDLKKIIETITKFRDLFISQAKETIFEGNKIVYKDIFINAISNRAVSTISAFLTLAETHNYLVSTTLIRFQLDNCLRLYASFIVDDQEKFVNDFMNGARIDKMKDRNNRTMNDRYLVEQFDKMYPGALVLYQTTSEYVHLSYKHLAPFFKVMEENGQLRADFSVGVIDVYSVPKKVDFAYNFMKVTQMLYEGLESYKKGKAAIMKYINKLERMNEESGD